jgi:branched-subunit amino acid aminotransferase/4-amino-4-deoxychorismate lyase
MPAGPWRLRTVPYQRPLPHLKHAGDFGQGYYQRLAWRQGFDEALLTGPGGAVCEGSITNIGFGDGAGVVWPAAPVLHGITMQLLERALPGHGVPSRRLPVRISGLGSCTAAFVTNARGIAPVGRIDDVAMPVDEALMTTLTKAYESVAADPL